MAVSIDKFKQVIVTIRVRLMRFYPKANIPFLVGLTLLILLVTLCQCDEGVKKSYYHPNYYMDDRTHLCFADGPSYTNVPCTPEVLKLINEIN